MDKTQPYEGGLMAVSSFGFGGANFHMVLEGRGAQRVQIQQAENSLHANASDDEDDASAKSAVSCAVPLAARTAEGLGYLARVVNKVLLDSFPICSYGSMGMGHVAHHHNSPTLLHAKRICLREHVVWQALGKLTAVLELS